MNPQYALVAARMGPTAFIRAPADQQMYVRMCADVLSMDSEAILCGVEGQGAWGQTFAIYTSLLRKQAAREYGKGATLSGPTNEDLEREWARFEADRNELMKMAAAGRLSPAIADHVGLQKSDLADPIERHERFGAVRARDWQQRALRLGKALHQIKYMTPEEAAFAPWALAIRGMAKTIEDLQARVAGLEKGMDTIDTLTSDAA